MSGQDNAHTGQGSQRADLTGVSPYLNNDGHGAIAAQYLNKAAFAVNALGTYGVLGRNTYRGPGSFNTDFGLHKDFPVTERQKFQFRFEAFNAFNNVNFSNPNRHGDERQFHENHERRRSADPAVRAAIRV